MKARMILGNGLNKEFAEYRKNILETEKTLQAYVFWKQIELTGEWLTPEQIKNEASFLLERLIETNLIQNGKIVEGILEYINDCINN